MDKQYMYLHVHKTYILNYKLWMSLEVTMGQKDISEVWPKGYRRLLSTCLALSNEQIDSSKKPVSENYKALKQCQSEAFTFMPKSFCSIVRSNQIFLSPLVMRSLCFTIKLFLRQRFKTPPLLTSSSSQERQMHFVSPGLASPPTCPSIAKTIGRNEVR